jgi:PAS domain S-box-containing protein
VEFVSNTYDVDGKKVIQCNIRDITKRKKAEEALKESEAFSTSLLRDAPNPVLAINPDGSIKYINPAMEKLIGYSQKELLGLKYPRPWWIVDEQPDLQFLRILKQNIDVEEKLFKKKNGESFWVSVSLVKVEKPGQPKYYLANWVDITQHKLVEEELIRSKKNFILAAKLAHLGPWGYDPEKRVFIFNDEFYAILGTSVQREGATMAPQKYIKEFIHPDDANLITPGSPRIQALPGLDNTTRVEHRIIRRDGQVRYVAVLSRLIKDTSGKIIEW